ncbi:MAG: hypothetical protein ACOYPR_14635, partial [Saprospiraceae bacterium]
MPAGAPVVPMEGVPFAENQLCTHPELNALFKLHGVEMLSKLPLLTMFTGTGHWPEASFTVMNAKTTAILKTTCFKRGGGQNCPMETKRIFSWFGYHLRG